MNIRQLEIFVVVAQIQNSSQAAKQLYISQPAVSQVIQQLESEVGVQLFDRPGRTLELNPAGKSFLQKVQVFLREYQALETFAKTLEHAAPIKVGVNLTIAMLKLADFVKNFQQQGQQLSIKADTAEVIIAALKAQELDLALLEGPIAPHDGLIVESFGEYEVVVVVSKEHPLAQAKQLSVTEFLAEPLLLRDEGSAIRKCLDRFLGVEQSKVQPLMTSINSQSLLTLVAQNIGITCLPLALVEPDPRFKVLRFHKPLVNAMQLVYHPAHQLTPAMQQFRQIVLAQE